MIQQTKPGVPYKAGATVYLRCRVVGFDEQEGAPLKVPGGYCIVELIDRMGLLKGDAWYYVPEAELIDPTKVLADMGAKT